MLGPEVENDASFLSQVVRDAPVPLWVIGSDGRVALANRVAVTFLGYRHDSDVVGGPSHDLLHHFRPDGSPYPQHECPIVSSPESPLASEWFVTRAGDTRAVQWSTRRLGTTGATLLSFTDRERDDAPELRTMPGRPAAVRMLAARAPMVASREVLRESMARMIEERFADPTFSTSDLADASHLSVRSVQGLFAEGGTSPAAEIRRLRLDNAKILLEQGFPVQEACRASGFLDPGTFARTFRRRFGLAPSQMSPHAHLA